MTNSQPEKEADEVPEASSSGHEAEIHSDLHSDLHSGRRLSPGMKLAVELGPLLVFFGGYFVAKRAVGPESGMIWATGAFVVVTMIALLVSYSVERRVPPMTMVTAVIVTVMGVLTIYLGDSKFIQLKPTIVSGLMGSVLLGGLALGKSLVQPILGATLPMDDAGWRTLTFRWALFFLAIAALNEVVRRQMSLDQWITFKTFGILPLTFIFLLAQAPLMERHRIEPPQSGH